MQSDEEKNRSKRFELGESRDKEQQNQQLSQTNMTHKEGVVEEAIETRYKAQKPSLAVRTLRSTSVAIDFILFFL